MGFKILKFIFLSKKQLTNDNMYKLTENFNYMSLNAFYISKKTKKIYFNTRVSNNFKT